MSNYPFLRVSELAKRESWRKEINRPIYHLHKWWAQRLGSVFRANVIHALSASETDEWDDFYKTHKPVDFTVYDPFMGSGTTLGEALKLGCNAIGNDINPVSSFLVQEELRAVDLSVIDTEIKKLDSAVGESIRKLHRTLLPNGEELDVLYYFWVMTVETPEGETIPLFKNYVISKNAYPAKKPEIQVLCPNCGEVFQSLYTVHKNTCPTCGNIFDPWAGTASSTRVADSKGRSYKISDLINSSEPPKERLYALLAIDASGQKHFLKPSDYDFKLYKYCEDLLANSSLPTPVGMIEPGYNASQPIGYGFKSWADLYNARELLSLGLLLQAIVEIDDTAIRNQLLCLFNGAAEFNNRFCSYKGEGTGAIRPIFSNHILKPERNHAENSVWGFQKSSGCFSTLYKSRYVKAKRYLEKPFEINLEGLAKPVCSLPIHPKLVHELPRQEADTPFALIMNGDSSAVKLPDDCVDAVITDPPYFDFVNYSELSDFFFSWLKAACPNNQLFATTNSRREGEVQSSQFDKFGSLLAGVFKESARVLKPGGILMFSFHHSRTEGWKAIKNAIEMSGFRVVETYPVYAELSASTPKAAAKEPITIDMLIVCKHKSVCPPAISFELTPSSCIATLEAEGFKLSKNDRFVIESGFSLLAPAT